MEVKQKKGISLIVLVITIIVMIIIAGAIVLSLNSSGILKKANRGTDEYSKATVQEALSVAIAEAILDDPTLTDKDEILAKVDGLTVEDASKNSYKYKDYTFIINNKLQIGKTDEANEVAVVIPGEIATFDLSAARDNSVVGHIAELSGKYVLHITGTGTLSMASAGTDWTSSTYVNSIFMVLVYPEITSIAANGINISATTPVLAFNGTADQWNSITKATGWNASNLTSVQFSDKTTATL